MLKISIKADKLQFIKDGPDIPNHLLQAHEEGRVVFFTGAGVSYPAKLPDFEELTKEIYAANNTSWENDALEAEAIEKKHFDQALKLLEKRFPDGRKSVRQALAGILHCPSYPENGLNTQKALLRLAQNREGILKLVTTNFDRTFIDAAENLDLKLKYHQAPTLPVPKKSRWNSLVHLHGLLPYPPDDHTDLNNLVVTSGDFGSAYVTDGWAARFVSELFRNFTVCFVG